MEEILNYTITDLINMRDYYYQKSIHHGSGGCVSQEVSDATTKYHELEQIIEVRYQLIIHQEKN